MRNMIQRFMDDVFVSDDVLSAINRHYPSFLALNNRNLRHQSDWRRSFVLNVHESEYLTSLISDIQCVLSAVYQGEVRDCEYSRYVRARGNEILSI